jgi:hypothetical protein
VAALQAALSILAPRGLISVLCYVGHEGESRPCTALTMPGTCHVVPACADRGCWECDYWASMRAHHVNAWMLACCRRAAGV